MIWIIAGTLAGGSALVVILSGLVLLALGIALLRIGRRDVMRSLRSHEIER